MDRSPQDLNGRGRGRGGRRHATTSVSSQTSADLAGLGVRFVVAVVLFLFVGKWLDGRLGTAPWLTILGVFVGAGASMYGMYRKVFPTPQPKPPVGPASPSP
jgi:F0F1-type ATP synthase assembly protein I